MTGVEGQETQANTVRRVLQNLYGNRPLTEGEYDAAHADLDALVARVAELEGDIRGLQIAVTTHKERVAELEQQLADGDERQAIAWMPQLLVERKNADDLRSRAEAAEARAQALADALGEIKKEWNDLVSSLIAVEPHLQKPYPDDGRWTPWTRFMERPMHNMDEAVRAALGSAAAADTALGKCDECGRDLTTEEAIRSDACTSCDPAADTTEDTDE